MPERSELGKKSSKRISLSTIVNRAKMIIRGNQWLMVRIRIIGENDAEAGCEDEKATEMAMLRTATTRETRTPVTTPQKGPANSSPFSGPMSLISAVCRLARMTGQKRSLRSQFCPSRRRPNLDPPIRQSIIYLA